MRLLHFPVPARQPGTNGRPPRHGRGFALADPATWPEPAVTTATATTRYGTAARSRSADTEPEPDTLTFVVGGPDVGFMMMLAGPVTAGP
jgi:hypothetical protein